MSSTYTPTLGKFFGALEDEVRISHWCKWARQFGWEVTFRRPTTGMTNMWMCKGEGTTSAGFTPDVAFGRWLTWRLMDGDKVAE